MRVVATIGGIAAGVALAGCAALCSSSSKLTAGVYVHDPDARSESFQADGYELELSEDLSTVVEQFRVGNHDYVLTYAVTERTRN